MKHSFTENSIGSKKKRDHFSSTEKIFENGNDYF